MAKGLRNNSTLAEVILWHYLKNRQMLGYKFNRQRLVENYIVDFFCLELKLAIEIDGSTHGDKIKEDEIRQKELEKLGINFLRFSDSYVKKDVNSVLRAISFWIKDNALRTQHTPSSPRRCHPSF